MKTNVAKYIGSVLPAGVAASATAQSTWNDFIADAGGGNSLLTWSVTGSLVEPFCRSAALSRRVRLDHLTTILHG